jgi:hypothetical protein
MSVKFSGTFGRLVIDVNPHQAVLFSLYAREANSLQQLYTSAHTVRNRIRFPFGRDYMHALPVCNVLMSLYTRLFIFIQNTIYSCCWCVCIRQVCGLSVNGGKSMARKSINTDRDPEVYQLRSCAILPSLDNSSLRAAITSVDSYFFKYKKTKPKYLNHR